MHTNINQRVQFICSVILISCCLVCWRPYVPIATNFTQEVKHDFSICISRLKTRGIFAINRLVRNPHLQGSRSYCGRYCILLQEIRNTSHGRRELKGIGIGIDDIGIGMDMGNSGGNPPPNNPLQNPRSCGSRRIA